MEPHRFTFSTATKRVSLSLSKKFNITPYGQGIVHAVRADRNDCSGKRGGQVEVLLHPSHN